PATRVPRKVQVLRCRGENLRLLTRNDAVERFTTKLVVVVRRINLISSPECQCQVVPYFPLVLGVSVILVCTGVNEPAGILEEIIRNPQQKVRAGIGSGEWPRCSEIKMTVV